jgi:hypothetical protein
MSYEGGAAAVDPLFQSNERLGSRWTPLPCDLSLTDALTSLNVSACGSRSRHIGTHNAPLPTDRRPMACRQLPLSSTTRPPAWHALTLEQALARCGVDPARCLDSAEAARRQALYGFNACLKRQRDPGGAPSVLLQGLVLYAPPMNTLFHTVPLPLESLLPLVALASAVLWAEELRRLVVRLRRKGQ